MSDSNRNGLFLGIVFVLLGLGFLLNNFGLLPSGFDWWPLFVMGAGLWMVGQAVAQRDGGGLTGGIVVLALGAFWLLQNYGRADDRLFLPVLLIALGVGLLLRNFLPTRRGRA